LSTNSAPPATVSQRLKLRTTAWPRVKPSSGRRCGDHRSLSPAINPTGPNVVLRWKTFSGSYRSFSATSLARNSELFARRMPDSPRRPGRGMTRNVPFTFRRDGFAFLDRYVDGSEIAALTEDVCEPVAYTRRDVIESRIQEPTSTCIRRRPNPPASARSRGRVGSWLRKRQPQASRGQPDRGSRAPDRRSACHRTSHRKRCRRSRASYRD
jgi:hypothetical protein